eukprot:TRINITY_DN4387_c0_g1_i1.p1 TRINITY_DN4387_c0_g1~~TRINITY_DN4387_c0_g1_i1.p1  ORF type:complete len:281 (+),score=38.79 TRINITY_DN4387_c0_g1_i1:116-958(+)
MSRSLTLNDGNEMPILGFGTFLCSPGQVGPAVKTALKVGYRLIDCAAVYRNEVEIGHALKEVFDEGVIQRKDVWITSKLGANNMHPDNVLKALKQTLNDLQLNYLDLYLVHIPVPVGSDGKVTRLRGYGLQDIWRILEKARDDGLVRSIGVSNFPVLLLNDCLNYARIPPAVNQVLQKRETNGTQKTCFFTCGVFCHLVVPLFIFFHTSHSRLSFICGVTFAFVNFILSFLFLSFYQLSPHYTFSPLFRNLFFFLFVSVVNPDLICIIFWKFILFCCCFY